MLYRQLTVRQGGAEKKIWVPETKNLKVNMSMEIKGEGYWLIRSVGALKHEKSQTELKKESKDNKLKPEGNVSLF
jgi:hypothetical protein